MSAASARQLDEEEYIRARMFGGGAVRRYADLVVGPQASNCQLVRHERIMSLFGGLPGASARHGTRRVARCSTVGIRGDVKGRPADEDAPLVPYGIHEGTKAESRRGDVFINRRTHAIIRSDRRPGVETNVGVRWRLERMAP